MPGSAGPTVPMRIASWGLLVAISDVSVIPQISQIGRPRAEKNSSTSAAIGAAPEIR